MLKKIIYYPALIITLILISFINTSGQQTITTEANSVNSCAGSVTVPILVTNINSISAISLTLNYNNTVLTWDSFQNEHEELSSGFLIINSNGFQVIISWFSLTPVDFGDDTLVELKFDAPDPGSSDLVWDLSAPDNCMYTDASYNTVNAIYKDGVVNVEDCGDIYGNAYYDNASSTEMNNVSVDLKTLSGDNLANDITDANGEFVFTNILSGFYTFDASTAKPWGGVNATDALGIMQHFVAINTLTGMRLAAADVDASGFVNSLDALAAAQRFTLLINSFPAGDWLFWADTVNLLPGSDTSAGIKAICYGDIDGSYVPPFVKKYPSVSLNNDNTIHTDPGVEFEIPVTVKRDLKIGAVSLIIDYPRQYLEIIDVKMKNYDNNSNLIFSNIGDMLRIAWFDIIPIHVLPDETLLILSCKLKNPLTESVEFSLLPGSEFAGEDAKVITDVVVEIPKIIPQSYKNQEIEHIIYPNPSKDICNIEFDLPEDAEISLKLFDATGRCLLIREEIVSKGLVTLPLDVSGIDAGLYYLSIWVDGNTIDYLKTETIVIE